jgi:hypothetical protein
MSWAYGGWLIIQRAVRESSCRVLVTRTPICCYCLLFLLPESVAHADNALFVRLEFG